MTPYYSYGDFLKDPSLFTNDYGRNVIIDENDDEFDDLIHQIDYKKYFNELCDKEPRKIIIKKPVKSNDELIKVLDSFSLDPKNKIESCPLENKQIRNSPIVKDTKYYKRLIGIRKYVCQKTINNLINCYTDNEKIQLIKDNRNNPEKLKELIKTKKI